MIFQVSTLRFATRMMCLTCEPAVNEVYDPAVCYAFCILAIIIGVGREGWGAINSNYPSPVAGNLQCLSGHNHRYRKEGGGGSL